MESSSAQLKKEWRWWRRGNGCTIWGVIIQNSWAPGQPQLLESCWMVAHFLTVQSFSTQLARDVSSVPNGEMVGLRETHHFQLNLKKRKRKSLNSSIVRNRTPPLQVMATQTSPESIRNHTGSHWQFTEYMIQKQEKERKKVWEVLPHLHSRLQVHKEL
jgi:hypothetical protein